MNDIINFEISEFLVAFIILLAFFLFTMMKLLKKYFIERKLSPKYQQYYYLLEIIVWIMFIIWAFKTILEDSIYYTIIVVTIFLSIAVWVTWFIVRDFVAGLVFKFNDDYKKGQLLEVNNFKGFIERINYLNIDLISNEGEVIKIPYSKIQTNIHKKSVLDKNTIRHNFQLQFPLSVSFDNIKEEIINEILLTPGIDLSKEPIVKLDERKEKYQIIGATVFVLSESAIDLILHKMKKIESRK